MTPLDFHLERRVLDNGLRVLISENPHLPLLSLTACVLAGTDQNPIARPGLAMLTAHLLDEGTAGYSAGELARKVEDTGGSLSTFSQREISGASFNLGVNDLELGIELLGQMLRKPVFPQKALRRERERLINQLRASQEDPQRVASQRLNRMIYSGTPLQHPSEGTMAALGALTQREVKHFHRRNYAPQNTLLTVVGDVKTERVMAGIESAFGDWYNPEFTRTPIGTLQPQLRSLQELHMDREQMHIMLGHLGVDRIHPDYHALQLVDVILGSGPGFTSRVPRRLREELGLAYTTYCDMTSSSGLYPGRFVAYVSTSPENGDTALAALLREIDRLREEGVTEEEMAMAKDYLTGSFVFDFQSNADLSRFLVLVELFELGQDYARKYPEIVSHISRQEVARVAREHLDTVNYSQVIVGPSCSRNG